MNSDVVVTLLAESYAHTFKKDKPLPLHAQQRVNLLLAARPDDATCSWSLPAVNAYAFVPAGEPGIYVTLHTDSVIHLWPKER